MEFGAETDVTLGLTPVRRPRQQVEDQLREAINSGALSPGDRLPSEINLANEFSVSRSTVREALRSLVSDGLIEKFAGSGGGSFVRRLDWQSVGSAFGRDMAILLRNGSLTRREVLETSRPLEVQCARLAAENRTEVDLIALRDLRDRAARLDPADPQVLELAAELALTVARASGNRAATAVLSALRAASTGGTGPDPSPAGDRLAEAHSALIGALEAGDEDAAEAAARESLALRLDMVSAAR